jgi:outer membrane lipoprotein-sorting protein
LLDKGKGKMMKITWRKSVILLSISVLLLGGCSAGMNVSAEEIIHNALESEEELNSYYGKSEMKLYEGGELTDHAILEEYIADGKAKIITNGQLNNEVMEVLNDGEQMLMYDKANKEATSMDMSGMVDIGSVSPKEQFKLMVDSMKDSHSYEVIGEEKVLDFDTYHIKLKANKTDNLFGDFELWVDKKSWFVVKFISETGEMRTEFEYTDLDLSPDFDESTFTIDIPDDIEITSLEDDFGPDTVTLEEAEKALGQPFYVFSEDEVQLSSVQMYDLTKELGRYEVELIFSSNEGIPLFTMSVFPTNEGTEIEEGSLEIRGNKAEFEEIINGIFWDEQGMRYSLLITNPDIDQEDIMKWAENMVLSSEMNKK